MSGEVDQLIEAIRNGDEAAAKDLHDRLSSNLRGFIRGKIGAKLAVRVDVEDVLQQTLIEILQIIRKGDRPIKDLDLLSRAIARNVTGQWARRKSIWFGRLEVAAGGNVEDSPRRYTAEAKGTGPRTKVLKKERNELIQDAIATLKPAQALIVRLRFFAPGTEKRKFGDIGDIIGKTPEATEKAYQRAKRRIRDYLERHYPKSDLLGDL